jgi:hypothetical protein
VTVAVPLADSAVRSWTKNSECWLREALRPAVNRLALDSVDRGGSLSAIGFHGLPAIAGDHMLVSAFGHFISPCCRPATLMLPAGHAYQPISATA